MRFEIVSPTKALVIDATGEELLKLRKDLTYTNTSAQHQVKRHFNNKWARVKDQKAWERTLGQLENKVRNTLLFIDDKQAWIRPGTIPTLPHIEVKNQIPYPEGKKVDWAKKLPFELHPYQEESWQKLLAVKHGHVEICTGAGKTAIILKLCRESGLRAAVVAPSKSIFYGLLNDFQTYLGKANVGALGDGKKKLDKKFTICIDDSLVNVKPGTEEWDFFSNLDMLIVDESHTWGAETLENLCHNIFAKVPYRFFMSATQTRGDGTEKLLQSIIGQCVHTLTTEQALAGGYICNHDFTIVELESSNPNLLSADVIEMKRIHFLGNKNIAAFIAKLANAMGSRGFQTLVLVEELNQIAMLAPLLTVPFVYAHSEKKKERLESLNLTKVDPEESVEKFNKNEAKVLIGTSCIATGTNIFPVHFGANWVGGSSEIRTKQGIVGRSVRLHSHNPFKHLCLLKTISHLYDFDVSDVYVMHMQLEDRVNYYGDSGTPIKRIRVK